FSGRGLSQLSKRLQKLAQAKSPFTTTPKTNEPAHWVRPEIVVEIKFNEWTAGGHLRQPVFLGIRDDKSARGVVREAQSRSTKEEPTMRRTKAKRVRYETGPAKKAVQQLDALIADDGAGVL